MKKILALSLCLLLCGCQKSITFDATKFDANKKPETIMIDTTEIALPLSIESLNQSNLSFDQEDVQEYLECEHDSLVCDFDEELIHTDTNQESRWHISTGDAASNTAQEAFENNNFFLWIDIEDHGLDEIFAQAKNNDPETLVSILDQPSNVMLAREGQTCLVYDYQDYALIFRLDDDKQHIDTAFYFTQDGYQTISLKAKYIQ